MMSTASAFQQGERASRVQADTIPSEEGQHRRPRTVITNHRSPGRRAAASRAGTLALGDELHDLRDTVSWPTLRASMTGLPVPFRVAPDHWVARALAHRHGPPVSIDSSTAEWPSSTRAVDRHLLAGAPPQAGRPARRAAAGTSASVPSPRSGARFPVRAAAARARLSAVPERARSSSTWPSSVSETITAAARNTRRPGRVSWKASGVNPRADRSDDA